MKQIFYILLITSFLFPANDSMSRLILFLTAFLCFYTVDANENAVVLRLGKYLHTTEPGLHFKIPFIDSIYKVKVDYQWKEEFGFRTNNPGVRTS